MKKIVTPALIIYLLLGQVTGLFSQKNNLGEFKLDDMMTQDPDGGKSKAQSIKEAMEWRNSLLNDENGYCYPSYQANAIKQANQMRLNNSNQRASNPTLTWEELGPGNVGGRTRSLLFDRRDTSRQTIYAGAVGGGIWKSTDGGETWTQNPTVMSNLAISCIAQDANGLIYFGTGEGLSQPSATSRNSGQVGNGLHMLVNDVDSILPSTVPSGISNSVTWCEINRIAINPTSPQDIYAATSGGGNNGLQHSLDGGQTWTLIGGNQAPISGLSTGYLDAADVKFSSDGSFVFASVGNNGASPGANFIESQDGGQTWIHLSNNNFPQYPSAAVRIEIAVAPSDPNTLYLALAANGFSGSNAFIYKSTDGGNSFTLIGSPGGVLSTPYGTDAQGWYDNVIAVNPADADKVYFGGTQLYTYSSISGSWNLASIYFGDPSNPQWVHADMHAIVFNDLNKDQMLVGCDGGVFRSNNAYSSFPNPTYSPKNRGYAVTQNYSVAADINGNVLGGAQDNGTNYVDYLNGSTTYSTNVYGGDGPYAEISHFDPKIFVGGYVGGNDFRSDDKGVAWVDPFDNVIDNANPAQNGPSVCGQASGSNAPFVTAFWLVETKNAYNSIDSVSFSDTIAHYPGEILTLTSHIKQPFTVTLTDTIPAHTTVNFVDPLKARLYFATYCGLWMTPDILDFSSVPRWFRLTTGTQDVKSLAASPTGDTIYFGTESSIERMVGLNSVLAFDTAIKGHSNILLNSGSRYASTIVSVAPGGRYIEGMDADISNPNHVLCAVAGYSSAGTPHVYHSFDAGLTWTAVTGTLPNMPVYQCVIDAYNPSHYIIGSELGVWDSYDQGATWTEQNAGINARLPIYRLRQQGYLNDQCYSLYIGTHGRGMWRCTTLTESNGCSVNPLGINNTPKTTINDLMVYPNPVTNAPSKVRIELSQPSDVNLRIIDMPGRLMMEGTYHNLASGTNELSLNTSNLANGTYLVVGTLSNGQTMVRTIVVAR